MWQGRTCRSLLRGSEQCSTLYWDIAPGRELAWTGDLNLNKIVQVINGVVGHVSDDDESNEQQLRVLPDTTNSCRLRVARQRHANCCARSVARLTCEVSHSACLHLEPPCRRHNMSVIAARRFLRNVRARRAHHKDYGIAQRNNGLQATT